VIPFERRALLGMLLVAVWLSAAGCRGAVDEPASGPLTDPEDAALALFALAPATTAEEPDLAPVARVVDERRWRDDPGALLDALEGLRGVERVRVLGSERLEGLDRWVLDLEGLLPGPTLANFSVQVERFEDEGWRVVWFRGPGVEWPGRARPRDEGLSTSPGSADLAIRRRDLGSA